MVMMLGAFISDRKKFCSEIIHGWLWRNHIHATVLQRRLLFSLIDHLSLTFSWQQRPVPFP